MLKIFFQINFLGNFMNYSPQVSQSFEFASSQLGMDAHNFLNLERNLCIIFIIILLTFK